MVQAHLLKHGQLHYDIFLTDFIKILVINYNFLKILLNNKLKLQFFFIFFLKAEELNDFICDFIESGLPFLKSMWPELRGNAAVIIGKIQ